MRTFVLGSLMVLFGLAGCTQSNPSNGWTCEMVGQQCSDRCARADDRSRPLCKLGCPRMVASEHSLTCPLVTDQPLLATCDEVESFCLAGCRKLHPIVHRLCFDRCPQAEAERNHLSCTINLQAEPVLFPPAETCAEVASHCADHCATVPAHQTAPCNDFCPTFYAKYSGLSC